MVKASKSLSTKRVSRSSSARSFLLFKVKDEEAAIALASDTPFGLASSVFSEKADRASRVAAEIGAGMVFINHPAWVEPDLSFGGVKRSGYEQELSRWASRSSSTRN